MTASSSLRMLVAATVLTCTALIAYAQPSDARGPSQRPNAGHLAELKSKLNLSADQESAWAQFEAAVKPPAKAPKEPRGEERPALTEARKAKFAQQREETRQAREEAKNTLRSHLNADQQKILDEETSRPTGPRGGQAPANSASSARDSLPTPRCWNACDTNLVHSGDRPQHTARRLALTMHF